MIQDVWQSLSEKLSQTIGDLEPVPYDPDAEIAEYETIIFDGADAGHGQWQTLLAEHLRTARRFEIHCWSDETEAMTLALQYGAVKPSDWKHGTIIEGAVTPAFREMLLQLPKPQEQINGYHAMTPFFGIMLDNGFSSEHYGTENHRKLT